MMTLLDHAITGNKNNSSYCGLYSWTFFDCLFISLPEKMA